MRAGHALKVKAESKMASAKRHLSTGYASIMSHGLWKQRKYQVAAVGLTATLAAGLFAIQYGDPGHSKGTPGTHSVAEKASRALTSGTTEPSTPPVSPAGSGAPANTDAVTADAPPTPTIPADSNVTVVSSGSLPKEHHTLRVVSARADLTGQRELAWAADSGHQVGNARCTQNFQFNPSSRAGERPTMLMCWRTSATKSVYTIAVDIDHRPSEKSSVETIDKTWSKLG